MKKQDWALQRLEQLIAPDLEKLQKNMIVQDSDGYHVFGIYNITKTTDKLYQVSKGILIGKNFSERRLALSWCIADKFNNNDLANRIQKLDEEKRRISADLEVRQSMLQHIKDPIKKEITFTKITARKQGLKLIENRLAKCVSLAKYCQIRGFNRDETARTRRTQTTR